MTTLSARPMKSLETAPAWAKARMPEGSFVAASWNAAFTASTEAGRFKVAVTSTRFTLRVGTRSAKPVKPSGSSGIARCRAPKAELVVGMMFLKAARARR